MVVYSGICRLDQNFECPCTKYIALLSYFFSLFTFGIRVSSLLHSSFILGSFFLEVCGIRFNLIRASMCSKYSSLIVFSLSCPWLLEVSLPSLFMTPCGIDVRQDRQWVLDLSRYWICWPGFE